MKEKVNGSFSGHVAGTVYVLMLGMASREAVQLLELIKVTVIVQKDAALKKRVLILLSCASIKRKGLLNVSSAVLSPTPATSFPDSQPQNEPFALGIMATLLRQRRRHDRRRWADSGRRGC